jgi:hypothetical protein
MFCSLIKRWKGISIKNEVNPVKTSLFLLTALFISGCAVKHDTLQAYVGEDIQKVVADIGYPKVAYDMEEGRRDFQWIMESSTVHSYEISIGALTEPEKQFDPDIKLESITPMFDSKAMTSECLLTMMTRWDKDTKSWVVIDYQQPTSGC